MSMAEIMREVSVLPAEQQNKLAAYLLHLRLQHDGAWRTEMIRRIDDKDASHWASLENWKSELAGGNKT